MLHENRFASLIRDNRTIATTPVYNAVFVFFCFCFFGFKWLCLSLLSNCFYNFFLLSYTELLLSSVANRVLIQIGKFTTKIA